MPALRNPRRERFAQEIVAGKSLSEAYQSAGYKGDRRDASKLRHLPDISRRLNELFEARAAVERDAHAVAVKRAACDTERVLGQFIALAFSDLRNVCSWGANGLGLKPSDELTPEVATSVQEILETERIDKDGNVTRRTRIRLVDKLRALQDLGRHLNFYDGGGKLTQQQAQLFVKNLLSILQRHVPPQTLDAVIGEIREARRQVAI